MCPLRETGRTFASRSSSTQVGVLPLPLVEPSTRTDFPESSKPSSDPRHAVVVVVCRRSVGAVGSKGEVLTAADAPGRVRQAVAQRDHRLLVGIVTFSPVGIPRPEEGFPLLRLQLDQAVRTPVEVLVESDSSSCAPASGREEPIASRHVTPRCNCPGTENRPRGSARTGASSHLDRPPSPRSRSRT